jgi:hypothetical protein
VIEGVDDDAEEAEAAEGEFVIEYRRNGSPLIKSISIAAGDGGVGE